MERAVPRPIAHHTGGPGNALSVSVPPRIIGTPFYLMEYCPGLVYKDPTLPGLEPSQRWAIYTAMNRVLCKIHSVDFKAMGLEDYGKHGEHKAACLSC